MSSTAVTVVRGGTEELAQRTLERSDDVLWSLALPGAVLHNLRTHEYLLLDDLGYRLWAYLDGARPADAAVNGAVGAFAMEEEQRQQAWQVVRALWSHGFVVERRD